MSIDLNTTTTRLVHHRGDRQIGQQAEHRLDVQPGRRHQRVDEERILIEQRGAIELPALVGRKAAHLVDEPVCPHRVDACRDPRVEVSGDPRERVVTVAYYALVKLSDHRVKAATDAREAAWFSVADLPSLARCVGPGCKGRWHKRSEIIMRLSQCRACCRLLARQKRNPEADAIFDIAFQKLPQIRAVYPAFARALETCLSDRSRALTTARVQRIMCISRVRAEMLMKEHGLDKAAVAVAAKSRCTYRYRINRRAGQRRSRTFPRWAKEQNARWRRAPAAANQLPLTLEGAA